MLQELYEQAKQLDEAAALESATFKKRKEELIEAARKELKEILEDTFGAGEILLADLPQNASLAWKEDSVWKITYPIYFKDWGYDQLETNTAVTYQAQSPHYRKMVSFHSTNAPSATIPLRTGKPIKEQAEGLVKFLLRQDSLYKKACQDYREEQARRAEKEQVAHNREVAKWQQHIDSNTYEIGYKNTSKVLAQKSLEKLKELEPENAKRFDLMHDRWLRWYLIAVEEPKAYESALIDNAVFDYTAVYRAYVSECIEARKSNRKIAAGIQERVGEKTFKTCSLSFGIKDNGDSDSLQEKTVTVLAFRKEDLEEQFFTEIDRYTGERTTQYYYHPTRVSIPRTRLVRDGEYVCRVTYPEPFDDGDRDNHIFCLPGDVDNVKRLLAKKIVRLPQEPTVDPEYRPQCEKARQNVIRESMNEIYEYGVND